uniref:Uncharacterized protein n=1 Tax=Setaria viridis TaxID=4556 RepID=A0A4V6D7D9_SETVI|nr:hypothetical protein SEVIR_5G405000v2 [Setaria viridis]
MANRSTSSHGERKGSIQVAGARSGEDKEDRGRAHRVLGRGKAGQSRSSGGDRAGTEMERRRGGGGEATGRTGRRRGGDEEQRRRGAGRGSRTGDGAASLGEPRGRGGRTLEVGRARHAENSRIGSGAPVSCSPKRRGKFARGQFSARASSLGDTTGSPRGSGSQRAWGRPNM